MSAPEILWRDLYPAGKDQILRRNSEVSVRRELDGIAGKQRTVVVYQDASGNLAGFAALMADLIAVQPFRDVFAGYELLAYLSIRATRLGLKACEVPVERAYPKAEPTPTKIKGMRGNANLLQILFAALAGRYDP